jgi:hypothetical protein
MNLKILVIIVLSGILGGLYLWEQQKGDVVLIKNNLSYQLPKSNIVKKSFKKPILPETIYNEVKEETSKEIIHIKAKLFIEYSPVNRTPEARFIITNLINNGYGIEYADIIYTTAETLTYMDPSYKNSMINGMPSGTDDTEECRIARNNYKEMIISEFSENRVGNSLPPIPNKELLSMLLDVKTPISWYPSSNATIYFNNNKQYTDEDVMTFINNTTSVEIPNDRGFLIKDY